MAKARKITITAPSGGTTKVAVRRLPKAVNIPAAALPQSAAMQSSATSILMPSTANSAPIVTKKQVQQAAKQAKLQAKQQALLNKYNTIMSGGAAALATGTPQPIDYSNVGTSAVLDGHDWSVTSGSPSGIAPSSGITDASRLLAPNLPTLPKVTKAQINRQRKQLKAQEKAINRINKLNEVRNAQAASLALGLDSPIDYSNVQPGGTTTPGQAVTDPNAAYQQPPTGVSYPAPGGYPQPAPYPQSPMYAGGYAPQSYAPEPYYPPQALPQGPVGSPVFSSQIMGQPAYPAYMDPGLMNYDPYAFQDSMPWQDTVPFDLPNMTPEGDLLYMEPDDSPLGEGMSMTERFAAFDDFEPLDSFAAFSAEPAQTNFWSGLTSLVQNSAQAYTTNRTAKAQANANLLAEQRAAAAAAAQRNRTKVSPAAIGIGLAAVGLVIFLATRKS